jgi:hypothetical protein
LRCLMKKSQPIVCLYDLPNTSSVKRLQIEVLPVITHRHTRNTHTLEKNEI